MRKYIVLFLVAPLFLSSCRYMWGKRMTGNGVIKTEERSVSDFKNVEVSGDFKGVRIAGPRTTGKTRRR